MSGKPGCVRSDELGVCARHLVQAISDERRFMRRPDSLWQSFYSYKRKMCLHALRLGSQPSQASGMHI